MIADALAGLRARRGRTLLAALGILAASLVVGTATTVGYSLATGFDRAAEQSQLPDVIARFTAERRRIVDARVASLPNLQARSYRNEQPNRRMWFGEHRTRRGAVTAVLGGRRGYLIVDGRDLRDGTSGEVVIERGLAREWEIRVGERLSVEDLGSPLVVGVAVSPDNVAFPLASAARVYVTEQEFQDWQGFGRRVRPNTALLWLNDPSKADVTLTQARAVAFGLGKLQFITRTGVRILLSQAAGIVISLLVAFSLVALVAAGTMLVAGAHADVQRRLTGIGVQRALGFGPGRIAAQQAVESARRRAPGRRARHRAGRADRRPPGGRPAGRAERDRPGLGPARPAGAGVARRDDGRRRRRDVAGVARGAPAAGRDPARRRPRPSSRARRRGREPLLARRALRHRRARTLVRGRRDDRRLRGRRDADARARLAARAAARGPGDGRQALPARGRARLLHAARGEEAARRRRRRRALQRRRGGLVPARRARAADRVPG